MIAATSVWTDREGYEQYKPVLINLAQVRYVTPTPNGDEYRPVLHWAATNAMPVTLDENFADFAERIAAYERTTS